jgi:hypothetical protein
VRIHANRSEGESLPFTWIGQQTNIQLSNIQSWQAAEHGELNRGGKVAEDIHIAGQSNLTPLI